MTEPTSIEEDDFDELYGVTVPRVDLVSKGANGMPILIAKSAAGTGILDASAVHVLLNTTETPEVTVTAPSTATEPVAKADGQEDLDASTVLVEPEGNPPGSDTTPGSPAWEATDAATARKWTAILSRAKNALEVLSSREQVESAAGDGDADSFINSVDLEDAACAIDYAIGVLAPFAVGEQVEADLANESGELIAKAADGIDFGALETIEALGPVIKAGRTLSASNEAAIRGAVDSLQKVLNSLPSAPDDTAPITKQAVQEEPVSKPTETTQAPPATEPVVKAKGDPQMAVYDANGKLVGTIDQADLNPIAAPEPPDDGDESGADDAATTADQGQTIPGTQTVQAPAAVDPTAVAKAADDLVSVLKEALPSLKEELGIPALISDITGLQERVAKMAAQPDDRKSPILNGGNGLASGQATRNGQEDQPDPLTDLRKAVSDAATPSAKAQAQQQLAYAEIRARFQ